MPKYPARTYEDIFRDKVDSESLRSRLKLKRLREKETFSLKFPHVNAFFKEKSLDLGKIRMHSSRILGTSAVAGALLLSGVSDIKALPTPKDILTQIRPKDDLIKGSSNSDLLVQIFKNVLPEKPKPLKENEEKFLEQIFSNIMGIKAKANLEGEHLNTTYGYIGAEQHLKRYPGDAVGLHAADAIVNAGMAPGLGAWGYFAFNKDELTSSLVDKEKWYAVVQTLYLPDWGKRQPYLKNWYKFRKVLIVNTENGNAVVADIADSGPAAWTGKHFGGSPEVMNYLGGPKYKKGAVIIFFVDDPENKVPLGPLEYSNNLLGDLIN